MNDRGATTAAMVVLFPVLIVMFMGIVQWGMWWHAQAQLTAAAQDAARATQGHQGTVTAGEALATELVGSSVDSGLVDNVVIDVTRADGVVRVEITGQLRSLVPMPMDLQVRGIAEGPVEVFVSEADR